MNKKLTIVLLAALLFASFNTIPMLTVKADISEVNILSYSWYFASTDASNLLAEYYGDVIIVGEIQNVGSNIIEYAAVEGNAFNSTGLVASSDARVIAHNILPGGKSPFYIDISPDNIVPPITDQSQNFLPTVDHVSVSVIAVSDTSQRQYADLTIQSQTGVLDTTNGVYTASGWVYNTGTQTASNVYVLATFYNSSGSVVAVNKAPFIATSLAPGVSARFAEIPADNTASLSSQIATYSLLVQSKVAASNTPSQTQQPATSTPTSPSESTQPTSSSSSEPTQNSAPILQTDILYLVVIVVAVVVVVAIALVIVRMRRKNAQATANLSPSP